MDSKTSIHCFKSSIVFICSFLGGGEKRLPASLHYSALLLAVRYCNTAPFKLTYIRFAANKSLLRVGLDTDSVTVSLLRVMTITSLPWPDCGCNRNFICACSRISRVSFHAAAAFHKLSIKTADTYKINAIAKPLDICFIVSIDIIMPS